MSKSNTGTRQDEDINLLSLIFINPMVQLRLLSVKNTIRCFTNRFYPLDQTFCKFKRKLIVKPSKDSIKRVVRKLSDIIPQRN